MQVLKITTKFNSRWIQCRTWWWCATSWCPDSCIYRHGFGLKLDSECSNECIPFWFNFRFDQDIILMMDNVLRSWAVVCFSVIGFILPLRLVMQVVAEGGRAGRPHSSSMSLLLRSLFIALNVIFHTFLRGWPWLFHSQAECPPGHDIVFKKCEFVCPTDWGVDGQLKNAICFSNGLRSWCTMAWPMMWTLASWATTSLWKAMSPFQISHDLISSSHAFGCLLFACFFQVLCPISEWSAVHS